jgi:hypothetical protein
MPAARLKSNVLSPLLSAPASSAFTAKSWCGQV